MFPWLLSALRITIPTRLSGLHIHVTVVILVCNLLIYLFIYLSIYLSREKICLRSHKSMCVLCVCVCVSVYVYVYMCIYIYISDC